MFIGFGIFRTSVGPTACGRRDISRLQTKVLFKTNAVRRAKQLTRTKRFRLENTFAENSKEFLNQRQLHCTTIFDECLETSRCESDELFAFGLTLRQIQFKRLNSLTRFRFQIVRQYTVCIRFSLLWRIRSVVRFPISHERISPAFRSSNYTPRKTGAERRLPDGRLTRPRAKKKKKKKTRPSNRSAAGV